MAQVVVSKCVDSLPLHRQAKAYRRVGVQVNDSTLGDLFHRTAELTKPLSDRLLHLVAEQEIVLADETTHRVQEKEKTRTAWLWSFIVRDEAEKEIIAYVSRGAAPARRRCACSPTPSASCLSTVTPATTR
jgi:transposase